MKKFVPFMLVITAATIIAAGCGGSAKDGGLKVVQKFTAEQIASWTGSITPDGSAKGSAEFKSADGGFTVVKVGAESWGGVESPVMSLDLTKPAYIAIRIKECNDPFKWTVKFVPNAPALDEHKWGFYIVEDNNIKWNKYVLINANDQIGKELIDLYGGKIEGKFWIWAAGAANANVEVREFLILQGQL